MEAGKLTKIINEVINNNPEPKRDYIGASSIGDACERKIWYGFNGYDQEPKTAKTMRTLSIGKRLESMVLDCLMDAGLSISTINFDLQDDDIPQFKGHLDAVWWREKEEGVIIEIKTAKDSSFKVFQQKGLRIWYPVYYSQVQAYMGMSGFKEAYVIALNKDTSDIHDEHVLFDERFYNELKTKAKRIIASQEPMGRINDNPSFWACRMCGFRGECHK